MAQPVRRMVPWEAIRTATESGFLPLPGADQAWIIRSVLIPGRLFRVAGPTDDRFAEIEGPTAIPTKTDGRTPAGTFAVVFTAQGRQTDRIIHLQGMGAPPRPQIRQGESS